MVTSEQQIKEFKMGSVGLDSIGMSAYLLMWINPYLS